MNAFYTFSRKKTISVVKLENSLESEESDKSSSSWLGSDEGESKRRKSESSLSFLPIFDWVKFTF